MDVKKLVAALTLDEKVGLLSGSDFWHTKAVERLGLPWIMVTDGPHGLRRQEEGVDHVGLAQSVSATCFPPACATGSSFDVRLLAEIGEAIGKEALDQGVSVVLGPGVNIKRSPLCGRNFEYFSEDPWVSGKLAAAWIAGVQSRGVGCSLKHFAANSQEFCRMVSDSVVDERALREIYLTAFEIAVKQAQPWTVMCSYNLINGLYASDNKELLTSILRDEWGFEGLVVSDWGAVNDRVAGVSAGLDLEMPSSGGFHDAAILEALCEGRLAEEELDRACERIVALVLRALAVNDALVCDYAAHHALARRAAAASCVLLKNEEAVLPLDAGRSVAVIGAFARQPRYQGTGSSKVNPQQLDTAWAELAALGFDLHFEPGYSLARFAQPDDALINDAVALAKACDVALVFAGLPDEYESEGFDRPSLDLPAAHQRLIEAVAAVNSKTVVILSLGAPVTTPWADRVSGLLVSYLGGEAGGGGVVDILTGRSCPSGRLAETWPRALADTPAHPWYPGVDKTYADKDAEYRESVFVGYRYYDTVGIEPAWPFGFGLSYTSFAYSDLRLSATEYAGGELAVSFTLRNTGVCAGAEVVQLYVGRDEVAEGGESGVYRAKRELRAFDKIYLEPGESTRVELKLDERAFAYYNAPHRSWAREGGSYLIALGSSSRDLRLEARVLVAGDGLEEALGDLRQRAAAYFDLTATPLIVPDEQFEALLGRPLQRDAARARRYDQNTILGDIRHKLIGRVMIRQIRAQATSMLEGQEMEGLMDAVIYETPLRSMVMMSGGAFTAGMMHALIDLLNGRLIAGLRGLLKRDKQ
ncbi:MAG: glycoside hydrolase family 3 C-terminal domain-containing protein [Coriobacteriia bacterium]|nr:glycoside hydrolase family 3 C-terminal domain-containing protein [Coriobacteriia bacterium]